MSQQYSYGAPPPQQGGYGAPPPQQQQHGYGAPPAQQGYGAPPPQQGGGYGAPPAGGSGGYPPQRPQAYNRNTGPPPGANPQLWGWFTSCDCDASGQIDAKELQQALVNGDWSPFDLDTVKMLMGLFDVDRSGHISFNEFAGLWQYIQQWQGVFRHFDQDRSGSIDSSELSRALANFGYNLSPKLIHIVTEKYINAPSSADAAAAGGAPQPGRRPAGITFDRFCRACIVIKNLTEGFQRHDTHRTGQATLTYENFMELALSAP